MKTLITNYIFNKTTKKITFSDYETINLERVLLIVNSTSNIIIFNFVDPNKGGTVSGNELTLTYNTGSMNNTDKLLIYYDDPEEKQAVTEANGDNVALGATTDAAVTTDANGSISSKLRGLIKLLVNIINVKVLVTPDGSNFYNLFGNSQGIPTVNNNIQSGVNLGGAMMSYTEMVSRGLASGAARKVLKATGTLSSGGLTINSWTDQDGNTYTAVTTGKTLYIDQVIVSMRAPTTTSGNAANFIFGNASNKPLCIEVNAGAVIKLNGMLQIASTLVPTAVFASGLSDSAVAVTIIGWEE